MKIEESISQLLSLQFFISGLLAIGLARNRGAASKEFLPGYQSIGVILSFTAVGLLFGGAVVLFFLPYLKLAAEIGYSVLELQPNRLAIFCCKCPVFYICLGGIKLSNLLQKWA